jgi:hypothetical protein
MTTQVSTRLPSTLLQQHIPISGRGVHPLIETDGMSLIIRNVKLDDGKHYDIRIWRYDDQGREIMIDGSTSFLKTTIVRAQELAKTIFSKKNFEKLTDAKVWFSDINPGQPSCLIESLKNRKYTELIPDHEDREIVGQAAELHQLFFHQIVTGWSSNPNEDLTIRPKVIPEEEILPQMDEVDQKPSLDKRRRKKDKDYSPLPDRLLDLLPKTLNKGESKATSFLQDPKEVTPQKLPSAPPEEIDSKRNDSLPHEIRSPESLPTPEKHLETLDEALVEAAKDDAEISPTFLQGITYPDLAAYSSNIHFGDPKFERAYKAFCKVRENPNLISTADSDYVDMKNWLKQMYFAAYEQYVKLEDAFIRDESSRYMSIQEWAKHYAAKAIAGYIRDDKHRVEDLEKMLESTPIPGEDLSVESQKTRVQPKRSWFSWFGSKDIKS